MRHLASTRGACTLMGIALGLILAAGSAPIRADSWEAPAPFETSSANGKYLVRVQPGSQGAAPAQAAVFKLEDGKRVSQWQTKLVNENAPVNTFISDDGEYLVTLDNHYSVGYGDNVMVMYGRQGLIRRHSLEQILADFPPKQWDVSSSVSSRWWRAYSFTLFDGASKAMRWGIWIGWAGRWFVWQLSDGTPVKLAGDELAHWNDLGIRWAREKLVAPPVNGRPSKEELRKWTSAAMEWSRRKNARYTDQLTACRVLAWSKDPKDRKFLEQLLENDEPDENGELTLRKTADRALAIQDGVAKDFKFALKSENDRFHRLGTLDLTIELASILAKNQGQIYVSIFPEAVAEKDWRQAHPALRDGRSIHLTATTQPLAIDLRVMLLPPGRYWVKIVWDRAPSHAFNLDVFEGGREWRESTDPAPAAGAGDLESGPPEFFEIKSGQKTRLKVKCDRAGGD